MLSCRERQIHNGGLSADRKEKEGKRNKRDRTSRRNNNIELQSVFVVHYFVLQWVFNSLVNLITCVGLGGVLILLIKPSLIPTPSITPTSSCLDSVYNPASISRMCVYPIYRRNILYLHYEGSESSFFPRLVKLNILLPFLLPGIQWKLLFHPLHSDS